MRNFFKERRGLLESLIFTTLFAISFYTALNWPRINSVINPPAKTVRLENVAYNISASTITGNVAGAAKTDAYGIIAYIRPSSGAEYFPKPSGKLAVSRVSPGDGFFEIRAYTPGRDEVNDRAAEFYCLLVVPVELDYEALSAAAAERAVGAWELARMQATCELWDQPTGN
jgi:hypothetical protein